MRIAVVVKQVPMFTEMALDDDGRLVRTGLPLELNPYCRRAVSQAVELAADAGSTVTVVTLGPPSAEDSLREAIAWGLDRGVETDGVLITDPAFAGSDTLATARALAAAMGLAGPFDLILSGRNSVDADTGQVPPELAELLDLPFLTGVRTLHLDGRRLRARCEHDDGWVEAEVDLPAVLSCAERLIEPCKVDAAGRAAVPAGRIRRLAATDLGPGPWGQAGSPTRVGAVRVHEVSREGIVLAGALDDQIRRSAAVRWPARATAPDGGASRSPGPGTGPARRSPSCSNPTAPT
jgi:electron transfer flavoprotein alpha/beta subunit